VPLLFLAVAGCTQGGMGSSGSSAEMSVPAEDRIFVSEAASGGIAEVALGQLAERNASSGTVRDFGRRMVKEHSQANDELTTIAKAQGLTPPTDMDSTHAALRTRLERVTGPAFDNQYINGQVEDHAMQLALFRKEAEEGQNPQLKAFAQKYEDIVAEHEQMAQQIQARLPGAGISLNSAQH
jgi:putative membrane protein